MASRAVCRAIWIPSSVALVGLTIYFERAPAPYKAPSKLVSFTTDDKLLTVSHPSEWKPSVETQHGVMTAVRFRPSKDVLFKVESDLSTSLLMDIAKLEAALSENLQGFGQTAGTAGASAASATSPPKRDPLDSIHALRRKESERTYEHYKETRTTSTTIAGIPARRTEYTYAESGTLASKPFVGAFFTAISGERGLLISYRCPVSEAKTLMPVFRKMTASVQVGSVGGAQR